MSFMRFIELISSDQVTPLLWLLNCVFVLWSCRCLISLPSACLIWTGMSLCSTLTVPWTEYLLWNKLESNPQSVVQVHKHTQTNHQMTTSVSDTFKKLAHKCCLFGNWSTFLTLCFWITEKNRLTGIKLILDIDTDIYIAVQSLVYFCSCSIFIRALHRFLTVSLISMCSTSPFHQLIR